VRNGHHVVNEEAEGRIILTELLDRAYQSTGALMQFRH